MNITYKFIWKCVGMKIRKSGRFIACALNRSISYYFHETPDSFVLQERRMFKYEKISYHKKKNTATSEK